MDSKEKKTNATTSEKEVEVDETAQEQTAQNPHDEHKTSKKDKKADDKVAEHQASENKSNSKATEKDKAENKADKKKPSSKEEAAVAERLDTVEKELEDYKDKYLRLAAEFDNYRRRTMKEKTELILNGSEKCINSILPVLDDLERALTTMDKAEDVKAIADGVKLIYNKFVQILSQNGVKEIETEGKELDTDFHDAIALVPVPDEKQKGKIIDCTQKGYTLNEKVIRHAKVVIGQ